MARKSLPERLLARLRAEGVDLPSDAVVVRQYPSRNQRSAGAWSWSVRPRWNIGSQYTMTQVLRADRLMFSTNQFGETHVDPEGV